MEQRYQNSMKLVARSTSLLSLCNVTFTPKQFYK